MNDVVNLATLSRPMIHSCGLTNVGLVRKNNEDSFLVDQQSNVFLVADGIGGHQGGEVASRLATMTAHRVLQRQADLVTPAERLRGSFRAANREVLRLASTDARLVGMGTTLVALMLFDDTAWIAHCGDSRCYLLRKQSLIRMTTDHSTGGIHGYLTHAIGIDETEFVTTRVISTHPGDVFVLCSDGLTNAIDESQISYRLTKRRPAEKLCWDLVQDALNAGGPDNVTVVVVKT